MKSHDNKVHFKQVCRCVGNCIYFTAVGADKTI